MDLDALHEFDNRILVERAGAFAACAFDLRRLLPHTLTYAGAPDYLVAAAREPNISAIITRPTTYDAAVKSGLPSRVGLGIAFSARPRTDFFLFHNYLANSTDFYRRNSATERGSDCRIAASAAVAADRVHIGDRVVIHDGVCIHENVDIGDDTEIWPGTVIGNEGFQFERVDGRLVRIAHVGGVRIGREVSVKSNCCIDRHIFGQDTEIGDQTKLDNLVYVGHCTKIGRACLVGAHAAITGSVIVGDEVWIGPNATISNSLRIGDAAAVSLGAVVTRDVRATERVSGNFAISHDRYLSFLRSIR